MGLEMGSVGYIEIGHFREGCADDLGPSAINGQENRTLTRAALREAVYSSCPNLSRAEARKLLDATFEEISEALVRGERVKLRSFGSFKVRSKRERVGRNPKTGVEAPITPRRVLTFKASPVLVAVVNGESSAPEDDDE